MVKVVATLQAVNLAQTIVLTALRLLDFDWTDPITLLDSL